MKSRGLAVVLSLLTVGVCAAQMGGGPVPPMAGMAMGMGPGEVAAVLGPDLLAACHGDLGDLGLTAEAVAAIDAKRFELQKKVIRIVADLRVLRLELSRLLDSKGFDLAAAQQKAEELTAKEGELRSLHLGFLSELRSSLTEEQWQRLRKASPAPGAMPCPHGGDGKNPAPAGK